jgi:hypothetical protein
MKRLFGGAPLLFSAFCAHAGIISTDFRGGAGLPGYGNFGAGYEPHGSDFLSNGSGWDGGQAWLDLAPGTDTLPLQARDHFDFQGGATVTGIAFLTESPTADATPIPEPQTLALLGLGAGALGLARQGKGKRA